MALAIAALVSGPSLVAVIAADPLPPPSNIGTGIPLTDRGPPPSEVDRQLVGPVKLLRAGTVDQAKMTVTLPLYRGELRNGNAVWYILTDTNDERNAEALGLNFSAKLAYADIGRTVRQARLAEDASLIFDPKDITLLSVSLWTAGEALRAAPGPVRDAGLIRRRV